MEAKDEIKNSEFPNFKDGLMALAISPNNIPVKIWIDEETSIIVKIQIDTTDVMQELKRDKLVKKACTVYRFLGFGNQVSVNEPKGI